MALLLYILPQFIGGALGAIFPKLLLGDIMNKDGVTGFAPMAMLDSNKKVIGFYSC